MNVGDIKNWKISECAEKIELIDNNSTNYLKKLVEEKGIPLTDFESIDRANTVIDWGKISKHYKFFFDNEGEEIDNEEALSKSDLSKENRIIFLLGGNEPVVTIPTGKFIEEWEDFIASVQWEGLIFSSDFKLIIEISRDYFMHSNFKIK